MVDQILDDITDKTKLFSLEEPTITGKCVSVYGGDTIKCVFSIPNSTDKQLYKWNCRLIKIDTPKIRTKNLKEKEFGKKVRDYLREKILNKVVELKCSDFDKYGRLLVEILYDGTNINDWLIENGYAKKYGGGKKSKWEFND